MLEGDNKIIMSFKVDFSTEFVVSLCLCERCRFLFLLKCILGKEKVK